MVPESTPHVNDGCVETAPGDAPDSTEVTTNAPTAQAPFSFFGPAGLAAEPAPDSSCPPFGSPVRSIDDRIAEHINSIEADFRPSELERHARGLAEFLATEHATEVIFDGARQQLNERLRALGYPAISKAAWGKMVREAKKTEESNSSVTEVSESLAVLVKGALPDAPVADGMVVPPGFKITRDGVFKVERASDRQILPTPVVITQRLKCAKDGSEKIVLMWQRDGNWTSQTRPREELASKSTIIKLAAFGFPVTSGTAHDVTTFLAEFEAANIRHLPPHRLVRQLGWTDDSLSSFLFGRELISGRTEVLTALSEADAPTLTTVTFEGADAGDNQVAAGFHRSGTFEGWKAAVKDALSKPRVKFLLLASLAAPLVAVMAPHGATNFVVDVCGETSKGKTTVLRLAASVWGRPDETAPDSAITSWNATKVGGERRAAILNGLPLLKDDTKLVRGMPGIVGDAIYEFVQGRGKDRGSKEGMAPTSTFRSVMATNGEARATSMTGDGGTRARVLTFWGLPFGSADDSTLSLVRNLNSQIKQHYGHAGPKFVQYLLDNRDRWTFWGERFVSLRENVTAAAQGNSVVARLADALALVALAGEIAAEALEMPELADSLIDELLPLFAVEAEEADRASLALVAAYDYAVAHPREFFDAAGSSTDLKETGEWSGAWPGRSNGSWNRIGFLPDALKHILTETDYEFDPVISTWKDRGWLIIDPSDKKQRHHQMMLHRHKTRLVTIDRKALAQAGHEELRVAPAALDDPRRILNLLSFLRTLLYQRCADQVVRTQVEAAITATTDWVSLDMLQTQSAAPPTTRDADEGAEENNQNSGTIAQEVSK